MATNTANVKPLIRVMRDSPPNPKGTPRLYHELIGSKVAITYSELAEQIDLANLATIFVLDSSFVPRHEVDACVWDALAKKRVVIPHMVRDELKPWLETPFSNKRFQEMVVGALENTSRSDGSPGVIIDDAFLWPAEYRVARQYYVTLLSIRKQRIRWSVEAFKSEHGREPSRDEMLRLCQKSGTERDFYLLKKGFDELGKPNYFADEDAVVTAGKIAFIGGCNTVILTRDGDVLEQFAKFTDLLTQHYQAMHFASIYSASPGDFATAPLPGAPEWAHYFEPGESHLVRKHVHPDDFVKSVLPADYEPVRVTCWLLGGQPPNMTISVVSYYAEKGIDQLLQVKGKTNGLSTDKLDGNNCHVTGFPIGLNDPRHWTVIAKDKLVQSEQREIQYAGLDWAHTAYDFGMRQTFGQWFVER
jgi:hypothetical protein